MAFFQGAAAGGLAAAFRQFRASGVPREALEQALSEVYQDQPQAPAPPAPTPAPAPAESAVFGANPFEDAEPRGKYSHMGRLSVSTTSSKSSGRSRSSVLSTTTSISSVTSQNASDPHNSSGLPRQTSQSKSGSSPRYFCTSCETTFARKYDWKRHEEEFHERYRRYPCPGCNRVFWGANTFNQHHKTAHNCTTCPHAHDVVVYTKRKCAWGCGICAAFLPSRDRFFDHVSKHFELGMTKTDHWTHSKVIYGLLHQPHVYQAWKELVGMMWGENQPIFSWNPDTTGRSPGFLENGSPGKLQDFLEFFSEKSFDVRQLVQLAHDQADIVPRFTPDPQPLQFSHQSQIAAMTPQTQLSPTSQGPTSPTAHMQSQQQQQQQQQQQMMSMVVGPTQLSQPPHHHHQQQQQQEYGDPNVPAIQVTSPQYMAPMRFTETIVEVPELEYYDMGQQQQQQQQQQLHHPNHHLGPGMPPNSAEDWSSLTATVVEEPIWADGTRYSHHIPGN